MKKNQQIIGVFVIGIIVIGAFFLVAKTSDGSIIGDGVTMYRIAFEEHTDQVQLHIPYDTDKSNDEFAKTFINIGIDLNGDGVIASYTFDGGTQEEWLVRNMLPDVYDGQANRFTMLVPDRSVDMHDVVTATAVFSADRFPGDSWPDSLPDGSSTEEIKITDFAVNDFGVNITPDPEGVKLTGAPSRDVLLASTRRIAYQLPHEGANTSTGEPRPNAFNVSQQGVRDKDQEHNECGPTAAFNSFEWLAGQHNLDDLIPSSDEVLIDELKGDMQWDNGVSPGNTLPGLQEFITRRGLPLEAHQVGGANDPDIVWKIYEELKKGQSVVVSIQFFKVNEDGTEKNTGAHLVTATGAAGVDGDRLLTFHDPGDRDATSRDIYQMDKNEIKSFWHPDRARIRAAYAISPTEELTSGSWVNPTSHSQLIVPEGTALRAGGADLSKAVSKNAFFNVTIEDPGDHFVNDTFTSVVATVNTSNINWIFYTDADGESKYWRFTAATPWQLIGKFKTSANLSPSTADSKPPSTAVQGRRFRLEHNFTCGSVGPAWIQYEATLAWLHDSEDGDLPTEIIGNQELDRNDVVTVQTPPFNCLLEQTEISGVTDSGSSLQMSSADPQNLGCPGAELLPLEAGGVKLEVVKLTDGHCYPIDQFTNRALPDACDDVHYHTQLTSLERKVRPDTQPCGAAGEEDITGKGLIWITADQLNLIENNEVRFDDLDIVVEEGGEFQIEVKGGIFGD